MAEIKYDIRRGSDIYRAIYSSRLENWILKGVIKQGETTVWRSGLSGWRKPEELEELAPLFEQRVRLELTLKEKKAKKRAKPRKKKVRNILIIDDEKDLCKLFGRILNPKGYNVATANTKREGLACIKREAPDLVFLDLKLPDGDGMDILSKIKKASPNTTVNIISAYGGEERREEAKRKGVYDFLDKPFTKQDILKSIKAVS